MLATPGTGVATYAATLAGALRTAGIAPLVLADDRERFEQPRLLRRWIASAGRAARVARADGEGRLVARHIFADAYRHFRLHRRMLTVHADGPPGIMHFTYPVPLRIAGWRNLYTVHDAIPLLQPSLTPIARARHLALLRRIAAGADGIVTVSGAARDAIVAALGCRAELVTDLGQAVDVTHRPVALPAPLAAGRYLIFCGSIEPRKNLLRLVEAYRRSATALPLVVAGPVGWRGVPIGRRIAAVPGVVLLPFQNRDALLTLIASARAMLFPSLAEGFGLPIAEAMALGTPVMTSAGGATAETAGGAALLVDPLDVPAMSAAIRALAADDAVCDRLREAGHGRARAFRIDDYGARLAAFYGCLDAPGRG